MSELNQGRAKSISLKTAQKFADLLDVSVDVIYGREPLGELQTATEDQIKAAFWGGESDLSPEEIEELWSETKDYIAFKTAQRKKRK